MNLLLLLVFGAAIVFIIDQNSTIKRNQEKQMAQLDELSTALDTAVKSDDPTPATTTEPTV